jgi:hypothetical protein
LKAKFVELEEKSQKALEELSSTTPEVEPPTKGKSKKNKKKQTKREEPPIETVEPPKVTVVTTKPEAKAVPEVKEEPKVVETASSDDWTVQQKKKPQPAWKDFRANKPSSVPTKRPEPVAENVTKNVAPNEDEYSQLQVFRLCQKLC